MNYELAKELKDAGFLPCVTESGKYYITPEIIGTLGDINLLRKRNGDMVNYFIDCVYIPTLEELIYFSEGKVDFIERTSNHSWRVVGSGSDKAKCGVHGSSIIEAVAYFWLSGNKR